MTTMTATQIRVHTQPIAQHPDPQVPERPRPPWQYPVAYKLRILSEYEQLDKQGARPVRDERVSGGQRAGGP
jgi:hypothetical protein